jgi:hypothetical protein
MASDPNSPYTTKDSGERAQFDSGMQRDVSTDKLRPDLAIDGVLFWRYIGLMTRGAVKYDARNWLKGVYGPDELDWPVDLRTDEQLRFHESAARHFFQWYLTNDPLFNALYPELVEEWQEEDHAAAVVFNLNGFETVEAWLEVVEEEDPGDEVERKLEDLILRAHSHRERSKLKEWTDILKIEPDPDAVGFSPARWAVDSAYREEWRNHWEHNGPRPS